MNKRQIFEIFGSDASDKIEDLLVYSYDASNEKKGKALMVVWPTSVLQIRKLILLANRSHFDIVPRGAGTGLAGAVIPDNSVVLDLSKMNRILKFDKDSATVTVEPGVILNDLNKALSKFGLFFPVIPSSYKSCTIGGMISTDAIGNRAIKYGRCSDWIKMMEIVDGTGKQIPIKDVKKFSGTEGTVGIVVKAELKLAPLIDYTTMDYHEFDNISDMIDSMLTILENPSLIALEYVDKLSSQIAELDQHKYMLFAEYSDDSGEINDKKQIEELWTFRESFGQILSSKGYVISEDPKIPLDKLKSFLIWLNNHNIPSFGHIGVGLIHPRFKSNSQDLIKSMFEYVIELGGEISGEHGIGISKKEYVSNELKQKILSLKRIYDPKDMLNRGKII